MTRTLVFGLTGQLGVALQPLLLERGEPVLALSRRPPPEAPGIEWRTGSLESLAEMPPAIDCILSLGPLDSFAAWVERVQPAVGRIVAIGSTGRAHKRDSADPRERELAARLQAAEQILFDYCRRCGSAVTVLRPSLLYGSGRDRSLSRLLAIARRWHVLPLPAGATGLRQPVHVADVARAVLQCREVAASHGRGFDLPGGEALSFEAMVRRTLARHAPGTLVVPVPLWLVRLLLKLARAFGRADGAGWVHRLRRDQLADAADARASFGYSPRPFEP